jgi:hypothetical protein
MFANDPTARAQSMANLNSLYNPSQSMYTPSAYALTANPNAIRSASSQVYPQGLRDPRLIHPPMQHQQPPQSPFGFALMSPAPQQMQNGGYQQRPVYVVPQQPNPYQISQTPNPFQMNQPPVMNPNNNNYNNNSNQNGEYPDKGKSILNFESFNFKFCFKIQSRFYLLKYI